MATFQDALLQLSGKPDIEKSLEDSINSIFLNNKTAWATSVVNDYVKYNVDPNESISKIAKEHKLNGDQIQRLVEDVNVGIYLDKYAGTKGAKIRRVEFELADPTKVNGAIESHASADIMNFELEKAASEENPFNAFTMESTNYEPNLWSKEDREKTASTMLKRKLGARIEEEKKAQVGKLQEILSKLAFIADALIYNERAEGTAQEILNKLSEDAALDEKTTNAIIKKAEKDTEVLKETKKLPGNFMLKLAQPEIREDEFSLGKHSLSKKAEAEYIVNAKHLPDMTTYEKLVQVAREIKKELDTKEHNGPVEIKVVK